MQKSITEGCELQIRPQGVTGREVGFSNLMVLSKFTFPKRARTANQKSLIENLGQTVEPHIKVILNSTPNPNTSFCRNIYDAITPPKIEQVSE